MRSWLGAHTSVRSTNSHEVAAGTRPARLRPGEESADATERRGAVSFTERELAAARIDIASLQRDVTVLQQALAKAREFAHYDELTGLPNRRLLLDHFNQAVARGARQRKQVAMLFLDLDGFARINNTLGHAAGDGLLQQVAARLAACIRVSDTACRLGGDEFVVLLPDLESDGSVIAAVEKIRAELALPFVLDGNAIHMKTSIGTAVYPSDGESYGDLMRLADQAMYRDKLTL